MLDLLCRMSDEVPSLKSKYDVTYRMSSFLWLVTWSDETDFDMSLYVSDEKSPVAHS